MSDLRPLWSDSSTSLSIPSQPLTAAQPSLPQPNPAAFQVPAPVRPRGRSHAANKENITVASSPRRLSLTHSPVAKRTGEQRRASFAPLTPSNSHSVPASPSRPSLPALSAPPSPTALKPLQPPSPRSETAAASTAAATATSPTAASNESIRVLVRVRAQAADVQSCAVVHAAGAAITVRHDRKGEREYTGVYDNVYGGGADTAAIFKENVLQLVDAHVSGFNVAILAYGQTGSGKTYTMMGNVTDKGEQQLHGIIPRSIAHIFQSISKQLNHPTPTPATTSPDPAFPVSYAVGMSYFEIYNEKVYDLLASTPDATRLALDVRETPDHQTYVEQLTTRLIGSADEAVRWIERGNESRRVAATAHNVVSSRSHGVIQVTVERKTPGGVTASRLSLVDLAGSEKYDSATHGSSSRDGKSKREEMSSINQSLSTLALVVNALTQQQRTTSTAARPQTTHIPYRNSTLTHLLKDSLGGHSKAAIIACLNPTLEAAHESTNTLKWASNAKQVRNAVKREEERSGHSDQRLQSLIAENERLKRSERIEKCKRYRVYELLPDFAMKVLEDAPEEDGLVKQLATDMEECKEQPKTMMHAGEEKIIAATSDSDDSTLCLTRHSSADLSVRLHDTLLESTVTMDSTLDSSTGCQAPSRCSPRRAQVAGVFASPSRLRWKVVRETFSSESARKPLEESAGSEGALFSPASQRRLEKAEEEYEQRRASWQREKERVRQLRNEKRRESVRESEKSIRDAQDRLDAKCRELDDIRAAYDDERSASSEERQRLLHQLDTVEEHNADKEEEVGRLLNELGACEARISAIQEQYAAELHSQSEALAGRAVEITALRGRVQEAETERLALQQRIAQLQSELRAADGVINRLQARVTNLILNLATRDEQQRHTAAQHQQQLDQLANELTQQQAQLSELKDELAVEQAEHAANKAHLQQIAGRLQSELDAAQQRQAAIQSETTERQAQYEASLQTAQARLDNQLRASEKAEQVAVERQRQASTQQKDRVATLQAQLQTVKEQLTASQAALSSTEGEHRADRIRMLQQFDAQLHSEQQRQRSEQLKYETALQKRRQVETAVIDQIHSRHHEQIKAAEQLLAAAKAEAAQQQQLFQEETEARTQQRDGQLASIQQQHLAELATLGEDKKDSIAAIRAELQAQVAALDLQLAAANTEAVQQRACHEAELASLEQLNATAVAALRAEYDSAVAALAAAQEQTSRDLEGQLAEQGALCERLQSHIQLVEAALTELSAEAVAVRQLLSESQQHVVTLQAELATTTSRHQRQIDQKNVQLLTTTYIACAAQTALKRRAAAHDAAIALITHLTDEKQQLSDEVNALQVDMAAMQATHELQLDAKDEQLASRSNTIAHLQGSGEESEVDRVGLHQRIDQLQDATIESEARMQLLVSRVEALQATIRQKDELLSIVQADAASQRAIAEASHERRVAELTGQVTALSHQQAAAQAMHERQTSELNDQLATSQQAVQAKDASLATVSATLSTERAARRDEAFAHHVRVASLEQQLDITESARSDAADNVRQLAADKQQMQRQLTDSHKRVRRLEAQLAEAVARRDAAEAQQKEVRSQSTARVRAIELRSAAALAEEKSERYTELSATMAGYDAQVARLEKQLAENHKLLDAATSTNSQLHDHIAALVDQQQHCTCEATQPGATNSASTQTPHGKPANSSKRAASPAAPQPAASHGGVATRVIGVLRFVTFGFVTDTLGFCTR